MSRTDFVFLLLGHAPSSIQDDPGSNSFQTTSLLATSVAPWSSLAAQNGATRCRQQVAMYCNALVHIKHVAISPLTADVLSELGYAPTAVAESFTAEGVVAAILAAERHA